MKNSRVKNRNMVRSAQEYNSGYITDSFRRQTNDQVISGYFPKTGSVKAMAIKKINNTLCGLLLCAIFVSAVSYYFVVSCEIKLNECSRVTTLINVENSELQNKLDKLKSFNNVDLTMQKNNLLHKPEKVIEALEVNSKTPKTEKSTSVPGAKPKIWSIGY